VNAGRFFEWLAAVAVRRPWLLIAPILALTGAGIFAATGLETSAGTDTLVSKGSSEFKATQGFHQDFGDEPVIVLVKEDLRKLVLTKDLEPLFELEECFAGGTQLAQSLPHRKKQPLPPVCDEIAKLHPSHSVFGPGTFLYLSVAGIQQALQGQIGGAAQTARAAGQRAAKSAAKRGASPAEQQRAANSAAQSVLSQFQRTRASPPGRRRSASATSSPTGTPRRSSSGSVQTSRMPSATRRSACSARRSPTHASSSATAAMSSPGRRWWSTPARASSVTRRCCCSGSRVW
jgi:hypothetical protein